MHFKCNQNLSLKLNFCLYMHLHFGALSSGSVKWLGIEGLWECNGNWLILLRLGVNNGTMGEDVLFSFVCEVFP